MGCWNIVRNEIPLLREWTEKTFKESFAIVVLRDQFKLNR